MRRGAGSEQSAVPSAAVDGIGSAIRHQLHPDEAVPWNSSQVSAGFSTSDAGWRRASAAPARATCTGTCRPWRVGCSRRARACAAATREGPITLLGDAAHPTLPQAGQGAAQSLEDAVALGRAFASERSIEPSLRRYERLRMPRTHAIYELARRNAHLGSLDGPLGCWLRDMAIRAGFVPM